MSRDLDALFLHQLGCSPQVGLDVGQDPGLASPIRIVATALERSADSIVLGCRRSRRLERLFSARVRERTTRLTALAVLTAHSPLKVTSPVGASTWTSGMDLDLDFLLR
jgi:hypothetical protein